MKIGWGISGTVAFALLGLAGCGSAADDRIYQACTARGLAKSHCECAVDELRTSLHGDEVVAIAKLLRTDDPNRRERVISRLPTASQSRVPGAFDEALNSCMMVPPSG